MILRYVLIYTIIFLALCFNAYSQQFTHQDTLRGSITPERTWWDLNYYHLNISINPEDSSITGSNTIYYTVLKEYQVMQIDLQAPLKIIKATQNNISLNVYDEENAHFIEFVEIQKVGDHNKVEVFYEGHPKVAQNPPWDGGITWKKDKNGNPFIASTCQGIGASIWWPCKDHMYDEVDSMLISVNVPANLMAVSNGRLREVEIIEDETKTYHWFVSNPINNYGVNINIADYVHFNWDYNGLNGMLDCDYYVLPYNLEKAKKQFKDADRTLEAFEYWFGPYPFYEDSYKLVEVPYLGMEHQSSVTYGNGYKNGYRGRDLSATGWGMKFDFIIVHESAHEWFANSITYKDMADMWIHESFAAYAEGLFVEYFYGKDAGSEYIIGTRNNITNNKPIIGYYNVNNSGSGDMYPKGSNMLHTLRQLIENDEKWREILLGLNIKFYHQTVTTKQIEDYLSEQTGIDLQQFFDQYLRDTRIPTLEYSLKLKTLKFRWANIVAGFDMPVKIKVGKKELWIYPKAEWKEIKLNKKVNDIEIVPAFYVFKKDVKF
jgi:aminopeptidase N